MKIIRDYIERIRNTRKFAKEQNVPVWEIPLINSIGLIILGSIYLGFWSWTLIADMQFPTKPFWWPFLENNIGYLPLIYALVIAVVALDKILVLMIRFQAKLTKLVYALIQKLDHKIWRKTSKESFISNKIWKIQQRWVGYDKAKKRRIIVLMVFMFVIYYSYRFWGT